MEAPRLYHIGEWYYLLAAEGGTEYGHMVHYYSQWVYSVNLGITGFGEAIDDSKKTARTAADHAMFTVYETFIKMVSEW